MALNCIRSVVRSCPPRLARLSTAPATREQPAAGPGAMLGQGAAKAARPPVPAVDFGNVQEAYRSRRTWELARSLLVLRLCASPALLAHHEQVGRWVGRCHGSSVCNRILYEVQSVKGTSGARLVVREVRKGGPSFWGPSILLHLSTTN